MHGNNSDSHGSAAYQEAGILIISLLIAFAVIVFTGTLLIFAWTKISGISPMPSNRKAVRAMMTALDYVIGCTVPTDRQKIILEPGCGWGTLLFPAARGYPETQVIGYELSPIPFLYCKIIAGLFSYKNVKILRTDFTRADFSSADVILTYLHPEGMRAVQRKIENETTGIVYAVSNTFQYTDWQAERVFPVYDTYRSSVYVYKTVFI